MLPRYSGRDDDVALRRGFADVRNVVLVEMSADVLVHPDERGMSLRAAQLQRLKDEGRDVEVTRLAAVGDLVHLHEAVARRAPGLVGLGLLLELTFEIGRALLELPGGRPAAEARTRARSARRTAEALMPQILHRRWRGCAARACARVSHSHS